MFLAAVGCADRAPGSALKDANLPVSSSVRELMTAGPDFFFLEPVATAPVPQRVNLDGSVRPTVTIEAINPATGLAGPYRVFAASEIKRTGGGFHLNWGTPGVDSTLIYRVSIHVGTHCPLGHQDIAFSTTLGAPGVFVTNAGRTIPIKFWIEASDIDGDGVSGAGGKCAADNCPSVANADQADGDGDHAGNACDNCVVTANEGQEDTVGNGKGDACRCQTVTCGALDQCHVAGVCSATTGQCSNPVRGNGTLCAAAGSLAEASCQSGACRRKVKEIIFSPPVDPLPVGNTIVVSPVALDSTGAPIPEVVIQHGSSDPTVATIDPANCVLAAVGPGITMMSASGDGVTAVAPVLVFDAQSGFLIYGPSGGTSRAYLTPNATANLVATFNVIGHLPFDATSFVAWSSSNPAVAGVGPGGVVIGGTAGNATITAAWGGLLATLAVTTQPASLAFGAAAGSLSVGDATTLSATALNAQGQPVTGLPVSYESSNPGVGTIDPQTGLFLGVSPGITTITASVGSVRATTICVVYGPGSSVAIATAGGGSGGGVLQVGATVALTATFNTINLPPSNVTGYFQWASNNSSVAIVSSSGVVTAVGPGTATITVALDGLVASFTITVGGNAETLAIAISGTTGCEATDVNADGVVVGFCTLSAGGQRLFAWTGGVTLALPAPVGSNGNCWANGVNAAGQVAGSCAGHIAVVWQPTGEATVIPNMWTAEDINDAGDIAGSSLGYVWTGSSWGYGGQFPALYHADTGMLSIPEQYSAYPAATGEGFAVNNSGVLAGYAGKRYQTFFCNFGCFTVVNTTPRGFRMTPGREWLSGPYIDPDRQSSGIFGLNNGGVAAGWVEFGARKAAIWQPSPANWTYVPLSQPTNNWGVSYDVNDDGVVVGEYLNATSAINAFAWRQGSSVVTLMSPPGAGSLGAHAVSNVAADGTVTIVGWASVGSVRSAVRWRLNLP